MLKKYAIDYLLCEHWSRKITVACIREKNDDCFSCIVRTFCKLESCPKRCSRRNSDKNTFCLCNFFTEFEGIIIFYCYCFVDYFCIESLWNKASANSLNFMR